MKKVTFNCEYKGNYFNWKLKEIKQVSRIKKQNIDLFHKVLLVSNHI